MTKDRRKEQVGEKLTGVRRTGQHPVAVVPPEWTF